MLLQCSGLEAPAPLSQPPGPKAQHHGMCGLAVRWDSAGGPPPPALDAGVSPPSAETPAPWSCPQGPEKLTAGQGDTRDRGTLVKCQLSQARGGALGGWGCPREHLEVGAFVHTASWPWAAKCAVQTRPAGHGAEATLQPKVTPQSLHSDHHGVLGPAWGARAPIPALVGLNWPVSCGGQGLGPPLRLSSLAAAWPPGAC